MKRILVCIILALSLSGLCACGETPQEKAARRLEEANRALAQSHKLAREAAEKSKELWAARPFVTS